MFKTEVKAHDRTDTWRIGDLQPGTWFRVARFTNVNHLYILTDCRDSGCARAVSTAGREKTFSVQQEVLPLEGKFTVEQSRSW